MAEELEQDLQQEDTNMYLDQIKQLKQNTVPKAKYDKLMEDQRNLLNAFVEGKYQQETEETKEPPVDVDGLRKELFNEDNANTMTELEYVDKVLKLRGALIESGAEDPFLNHGAKAQNTAADYEVAERVANGLQECVDAANGDPAVFKSEFLRRLK